MASFEYVLSTEHNNYENLTVYDRFFNGSQLGWQVRANEGYVMYHTNDHNVELDPDTNEEIPVIYYYTQSNFPQNYNWDNFDLVAVPRSEVDENYIFGGGNNDHEIM